MREVTITYGAALRAMSLMRDRAKFLRDEANREDGRGSSMGRFMRAEAAMIDDERLSIERACGMHTGVRR